MSATRILAAAVGLALTTQAALAGAPISERRPLKPDAHVVIENTAGAIEVQAWDKSEIAISGELGEGAEKLDVSGGESDLRIVVKLPKNARDVEDTVLKVRLPAGVDLAIEAVSADVAVQGVRGPVAITNVSGDVNVDVQARKVTVGTVSGDVNVHAPASETQLQSVSGDITVDGLTGKVSGETVSGYFNLRAKDVGAVDVNSVSGDLNLDLVPTETARVTAKTLSGEVVLTLPSNASATVSLSSFSGECDDDDGPEHSERSKRREIRLGKGGAQIELSSFSGDVRLNKR